MEKAAIAHWAFGRVFPSLWFRNQCFGRTIRIGQDQFGQERLPIAEIVPVGGLKRGVSTPPALIKLRHPAVLARLDQRSDVEGLIEQGLVVLGHAGIQVVLRDSLSIEQNVINTSSGHIEPSLFRLPFRLKLPTKQHRSDLFRREDASLTAHGRIGNRRQGMSRTAVVLHTHLGEACGFSLRHLIPHIPQDRESNVVTTGPHGVQQQITHLHAIDREGRAPRVGGNLHGMRLLTVRLVDQRARHTDTLERLISPVLLRVTHTIHMQGGTVRIGQLYLYKRLIFLILLPQDILVRIHQTGIVRSIDQGCFPLHLHLIADAEHRLIGTVERHGRLITSNPASTRPSGSFVRSLHQASLEP